MDDICINGKPLAAWNAHMFNDWTVKRDSLTQPYLQSANTQSFVTGSAKLALKKITFTLDYTGDSKDDSRAQLELLMVSGPIEIYGPDGRNYKCVLQEFGEENRMDFSDAVSVSYTFYGYAHGYQITIPDVGGNFWCYSTVPYTDCVISATNSSAGTSTLVAGITFSINNIGDRIVIDGENHVVTVNGENGILKCDMTEFPKLKSGYNYLNTYEHMKLSYIPVFM